MFNRKIILSLTSFIFLYFAFFPKSINAATVITTCDELQAMSSDLTADYELGNDIDCTTATREGGSLWNDGTGFQPVGTGSTSGATTTFMGTFDGQGYKITGLYSNSLDGSYGGIFGSIGKLGIVEPVIRDVEIIDIELVNVDLYGGGVVGIINYMGKVEKVTVSGSIHGRRYIGGIVGWNNRGKIYESSSDVDINRVTVSSTGYAVDSVGGIAGDSTLGDIKDCYAKGSIHIEAEDDITYVGGLIGYLDRGTVKNCYANVPMQIVGGPWVEGIGGLIGYHDSATTYSSYSTGLVTASGDTLDSVGGFMGYVYGAFDNVGYLVQGVLSAIGYDDSGGTAVITYQEEAISDFYPSTNLIYSDPDSSWDFTTIWSEQESALPIFVREAAAAETPPAEDSGGNDVVENNSEVPLTEAKPGGLCHKTAPVSKPILFQINITGNSAKVYYTPVSGEVIKYYVSYSENSQTLKHGFFDEINYNNTGVQTAEVFSLKPNTNYYFRIRAFNDCVPGPWSNEMKIKTNVLNSSSRIFYMNQSFTNQQVLGVKSEINLEEKSKASIKPSPTSDKNYETAKPQPKTVENEISESNNQNSNTETNILNKIQSFFSSWFAKLK